MKHFKLVIEYDGTDLHGWQVQPDHRTVQGDMEKVLSDILPGQAIQLTGSGRTDSGVHARAQVAHITLDTNMLADDLQKALNALLKKDIRVISCELAAKDFHARYSAVEREYNYRILRHFSTFERRTTWWVSYDLDLHLLKDCAELIKGEHDFTVFCKATAEVDNKICTVIKSHWQFDQDLLLYTVSANRFLQHMVRYLVGTMVEVARGRYSISDFEKMINNTTDDLTVVRAPAQGLCLSLVTYA